MVLEYEFPDTGEGVTEGKFLEWKVNEGDIIEEDQVLAEAETDKAVVEVPAPADGKVEELIPEPGDQVEVGEIIMKMQTTEEDEKEETNQEEQKETKNTKNKRESPITQSTSKKVLALPKVRKLAAENNINLEDIKNSGRVTEEEIREVAGESTTSGTENQPQHSESESTSKEVKATPSVRKLAREKEIDLAKVDGSGRGGKITREDVLNANSEVSSSKHRENKESREPKIENVSNSSEERKELSALRKGIAKKMEESRFTKPHVTQVDKADVTDLVDLREREKDKLDVHLTYLPFIMKATLEGLKDFPELNAEFDSDNQEIILKKNYNFNIAVDTEEGLVVPVVESIDDKSIVDLANGISNAVERAKNHQISRKEMDKGTFSITNLGVIGGEEFTPIINPPQTAILGIGKIEETAEVVDGEVTPRHTVKLSLSYDHRVIDGATAARFLNTVIENLENPEKLLMRL